MKQECEKIVYYLIGKIPPETVIERYEQAHQNIPFTFNASEQKIWNFCLKKTFYMGIIDAGLAILAPFSTVRKKMYLIFCILETTPEYASYYLPEQRSFWFLFHLSFKMAYAVVKAVLGCLVLLCFFKYGKSN